MNANLHSLSIRNAAALMNVSPRLVYMARELLRTGRADLEAEVMAGRLSVLGALKIAKPERYATKPDRLRNLVRAWCAAGDLDRETFLEAISMGDAT